MPSPTIESGLCARDMMITRVKTVRPDTQVIDAVNMLLKYGFSGAPVLDESGALVGILSEKDCIQALMRAVVERLPSSQVKHVMTKEVITITPDTHVLTIAHMFLNKPIRRLPVVENGQLVGQISRRDLLKHAAAVFEKAPNRGAAVLYLSAVDGSQSPH